MSDLTESRFKTALLIRAVETKLLSLFAEGRLNGTVHTCIGQEFSGIAVAEALEVGDTVISNHRCHGHFIARTGEVEGLIAELMGKSTGVCGGRGGSQHLHQDNFFSNGVQGGIAPVATGLSWAAKRRGKGEITVVFLGDGTLGEGVVYESLNIAAKWKLPILFVLENNRVSQSTAQEQTLAGTIDGRAAAFGIPTGSGETWSVDALMDSARIAVETVRSSSSPFFLRIDTDRLMAHSKGDDDRPSEEIKRLHARDPLGVFKVSKPEDYARFESEANTRVEAAVAEAESAPVGDLGKEDEDAWSVVDWSEPESPSKQRVVERINLALANALDGDARVVVFGEDLESPYGGAFKATRELSERFPSRVCNTPISEAAIAGLANGAALGGDRPVGEFMFGDFLTLAADQWINHASKFGYMYGDSVSAPLVLRTPMGGRRGYGPTHSQSLEKHFLGLPRTRVLALNGRVDPLDVYKNLFDTLDRPSLVIENKLLYARALDAPLPPGFTLEHSNEIFPTVRLKPGGKADATIFCWGGALEEAEAAARRLFEEEEIAVEIIAPLSLYPFNAAPLIESVKKTQRLLIIEEGLAFASLGSEASVQILERAPGALKAMARLASARTPIPSAKSLEAQALPSVESVIARVKELIDE